MRKFWKSRKFWATIAGAVWTGIATAYNVPAETVATVAGLVGAYVVGQGIADVGKASK